MTTIRNLIHEKLNSSSNHEINMCLHKIWSDIIEPCFNYLHGQNIHNNDFNLNGTSPHLNILNCDDFDIKFAQIINNIGYDNSKTELLYGKVQAGKTRFILSMLWFTEVILERPILVILRRSTADLDQFKYRCEKFNDEILEVFEKNNLYGLNSIVEDRIKTKIETEYKINATIYESKGSSKNTQVLTSKGSSVCICDIKILEKINTELNKKILRRGQICDYSVLIDEGDQNASSADNQTHKNDKYTKHEELLSMIKKKVKYTMLITATFTSLLPNHTTIWNHGDDQYPIYNYVDKIFSLNENMVYPGREYYGLLNTNENKIYIEDVGDIFEKSNENKDEIYMNCLNNIIDRILGDIKTHRMVTGYFRHLLVSYETIILKQKDIFDRLLEKYSDENIIIVMTNSDFTKICVPHDSNAEFKCQDIQHTPTHKIMSYPKKHAEKLDVIYDEINKDKLKYNFVITICGFIADRGISFVSKNGRLHLTDQFMSDKKTNSTVSLQNCRIQGQYSQSSLLATQNLQLRLWATTNVCNVIEQSQQFYNDLQNSDIFRIRGYAEIKHKYKLLINSDKRYIKLAPNLDSKKRSKNIVKNKINRSDIVLDEENIIGRYQEQIDDNDEKNILHYFPDVEHISSTYINISEVYNGQYETMQNSELKIKYHMSPGVVFSKNTKHSFVKNYFIKNHGANEQTTFHKIITKDITKYADVDSFISRYNALKNGLPFTGNGCETNNKPNQIITYYYTHTDEYICVYITNHIDVDGTKNKMKYLSIEIIDNDNMTRYYYIKNQYKRDRELYVAICGALYKISNFDVEFR